MTAKSVEAVLIGVGLWIAGATAVVLLGGLGAFHVLAPPGALLLIPVMYGLTRWHLRDVASTDRSSTGLRLAVLVTGKQLPLHLLAFLSVYDGGFPDLSLGPNGASSTHCSSATRACCSSPGGGLEQFPEVGRRHGISQKRSAREREPGLVGPRRVEPFDSLALTTRALYYKALVVIGQGKSHDHEDVLPYLGEHTVSPCLNES